MLNFGEEFNIASQLLIMATLTHRQVHSASSDMLLKEIDIVEYALLSSPIPCAIIDDDNNFRYVNESFASLVGYSRSELESKKYLSLTHPEDLQGHKSMIGRLLKGEQDQFTFQKRYITKFENVIKVYLYVQAIESNNASKLFFVHVLPIEVYTALSTEGKLNKNGQRNSKPFSKRLIFDQLEKHWLAILLALVSLIMFIANYIVDYNRLKWEVEHIKDQNPPAVIKNK
jgi:PAS domain S-box-containing protein